VTPGDPSVLVVTLPTVLTSERFPHFQPSNRVEATIMRMRILTLFIPLILVLISGTAFSKGRKHKKHANAQYYGERVVHVPPGQVVRSCQAAPRGMHAPRRFKMRHNQGVAVPVYRAAPPGLVHHHRGGYGGNRPYPYPPPHPRRGGVRGYIGINVGIGIGF